MSTDLSSAVQIKPHVCLLYYLVWNNQTSDNFRVSWVDDGKSIFVGSYTYSTTSSKLNRNQIMLSSMQHTYKRDQSLSLFINRRHTTWTLQKRNQRWWKRLISSWRKYAGITISWSEVTQIYINFWFMLASSSWFAGWRRRINNNSVVQTSIF